MNNSTSQYPSPREETLQYLRIFARLYHPSQSEKENESGTNPMIKAIC